MTITDTTRTLDAAACAQVTEDAAALAAAASLHREKNHYAVGVSRGPGCWWKAAIATPGNEHRVAATLLAETWPSATTVRVWVLAPTGALVLALTGSTAELRRELVGRTIHPLLRPALGAWHLRATARKRRAPISRHPALRYGAEIAHYMMADLFADDHLVAYGRTDEEVQHLVGNDERDAREWALAELTAYADDEEIRIWQIVGGVIVHQAAGPAAEVRRAVAGWDTPALLAPMVTARRIRRAVTDPRGIESRNWPATTQPDI